MNKKRNVIVHVHIFKNAGSSLDGALERNFQDAFVDHREDHLIRTNEEFLKEYLQEHENIQAFSSHSVYFKPKSFDNVDLHPIYMLRHPIERIKSVYSFEKKQPAGDSLGAKMAKQFSFTEYVEWRMHDNVPPTIRNLQTVFLAGANHHANHLDKKFQLALETLDESPLIGVVDRYDESMVVFEEYLRPFFQNIDLSYVRKNVTDTNTELSVEEKANKILMQFDVEMQDKIKEKNKYDLELYERANILLDEKIEKIDNFREKLYDFKKRCMMKNGQSLNPLNKLLITKTIDSVLQRSISKKEFTSLNLKLEQKFKNKDYHNLIKLFEKNKDLFAKEIKPLLLYAETLEKILQLDKALKEYNEIIEKFPKNFWAYALKVRCLNSMKRYDEAKKYYHFTLEKFPENSCQIMRLNNKREHKFFVTEYQLDISNYKIEFIKEGSIAVFNKPLNSENYYMFNKIKYERPNLTTYKIEEAYITIDFNKKYQYEFYVFNKEKQCIKKFSTGKEPFFSTNVIEIEEENIAFIEDKFTKFNIAHLYLDKLTRIPLFEKFKMDKYILFSHNQYIDELFKKLNITPLYLDEIESLTVTYKIKNLYINSSSFYDFKHPAQEMSPRSVNYLKHISSQFPSKIKDEHRPLKIFIDRSLAQTRNIVNMEEVTLLLNKYDIKIVQLETLSLYEQIEYFKSANLIIGVHGAGLTNVLFASKNTKVIEILPPLCATTAFWKLSISMGLDYNCLIGVDPEGIKPDYDTWIHDAAKYNTKNVIVPIGKLEKLICI